MSTQDTKDAAYVELLASHWSTSNLVAFALNWNAYSDDYYAPLGAPVWKCISSSQEAATAFYASIKDEQELRELVCDALAWSGWTLSAINYKKS